jgi:hypothetical protein
MKDQNQKARAVFFNKAGGAEVLMHLSHRRYNC